MIALLSEHRDCIPSLAAGYRAQWPEWYGREGPGDAEADLGERAGEGPLPFAMVAFDAGQAVGTAAITSTSIASRAHLSPWLTGLWVAPSSRGKGIAGRLIAAAVAEARRRGDSPLFVATERGQALFERGGWRLAETVDEDGHRLAVLVT